MASDTREAMKRLRQSPAFRRAEKKLDFWAVVLHGYTGPKPVEFGDNKGLHPLRVGITRDVDAYIRQLNIHQPMHPLKALHWVYVQGDTRADRIKAKIATALVGVDSQNHIRESWCNTDADVDIVWTVLLGDAMRALADGGETIEIFDDYEVVNMIIAEARKVPA